MKTTSTGELEKKTIKELVVIYNEHAEKPVKTFKDKGTAVTRVLGALAGTKVNKATKAAKKTDKKTTKKVAAKNGERKGRQRSPFDLPAKDVIKNHREGTKRAKVIELLTKGATFEEVMEETGWNKRNTYEGINLVHHHVGYGLKEDPKTGIIKLRKK